MYLVWHPYPAISRVPIHTIIRIKDSPIHRPPKKTCIYTFECTLTIHRDVRYNVHMNENDMITVSEFRKNTKIILDGARDTPVILRRGDELFHIQRIGSIWQGIPRETIIQNTPLPKNTEPQNPEKIKSEATPRVSDLFATPAAPEHDGTFEMACCKNEQKPCKHWVWDVSTGEGYRNSLSGRFLEIE